MLSDCYFADGHLTPQAWRQLTTLPDISGPSCTEGAAELTQEDRVLLLSHLESCRECMSRFLDTLEEGCLLTPPEGLEDRVAAAVAEESVRQTEGRRAHRARILQITKLAVAVCLTMVLFYGGSIALWMKRNPALVQCPEQTTQEEHHADRRPNEEKRADSGSFLTDLGRSISDGFLQFADLLNNEFQFEGDGRS